MIKKTISYFLIILIVFSSFSLYNSNNVYAQENKVCCEKTVDGEFCQFSNEDNCDLRFRKVSASCEQTSYCLLVLQEMEFILTAQIVRSHKHNRDVAC